MARYHIIFTGRVQGVGFRWRARMAAGDLRLTGWVRNMWDGSVEMEIQGKEEHIDQLINTLMAGRYILIDNIVKERVQIDERENTFEVRH